MFWPCKAALPHAARIDDHQHQSPMGRPGQPAEMAPVYVFLASPGSSYVNATTVNANGGLPTP